MHRPVLYLKHNVSEIGFCLRLHVKAYSIIVLIYHLHKLLHLIFRLAYRIGGVVGIHLAHDRMQWRSVVDIVMNLQIS
jgi:hypothetical protein